jgi:superfamily II DNA/RNA helicase
LLGKLARARRRLATAKVKTTIEFIENALEQGEKVLVFSCFTAPIERIQRKFKEVCVTLTGKTPQNKRQGIVDRFQEDDSVRVMAANIIAGGIGLNLTAARQVVFNDLDWVPTNHWQAEDRAYRIGQTGTVQVTYMVADETIDTFVRAVLETKAALADAIVEGEALPAFATSDIFSDLVGLMESLRSSGTRLKGEVSEENVGDWVREAQKEFQVAHPIVHVGRTTRVESLPAEALDALIRALSGPESKRYRVASKSGKGKFYEIEQSGPDLICSCPGFEYRGTCRHTKDLKEALVKGSELPDGVEEMG